MSDQLEFNAHRKGGICHECGAKKIEYKFGLNRGLTAFLLKLAQIGRPVTLDEISLTPGQYTNHALVRHWGLAEMMEPANELEARKGGKWRLTDDGVAFLRGDHAVAKNVYTVRGRITRISGPQIRVSDIDEGYMYRGDYRAQATAQLR